MTYVRMADAAFAANIPPGYDIAAGYISGGRAYHIWPAADWKRFPGFKKPISVPGFGGADVGTQEGRAAVDALHALGVPAGVRVALDMEARSDRQSVALVEAFGAVLGAAKYLVEVYGSRSTVFKLPPLNGYWVAAYGLSTAEVDAILQSGDHVRGVQHTPDLPPGYDASLVKQWTEGEMWHG